MPLDYLRLMRPKQWLKNGLLFAGVFFSQQFTDPRMLAVSAAAFVLFCLLSSAVYIVNDWRDREADRLHPRKRERPLAAGRIAPGRALALALALAALALAGAFSLPRGPRWDNPFAWTAVLYLLSTLAYTFHFKRVAVVDVLLLALGFVMRAVAGVLVLRALDPGIAMTAWFVICVFFLALFIVVCKRRHELISMEEEAAAHREVLAEYNAALLDQLISVSSSATVISYALYLTANTPPDQIDWAMLLTLPLVLFGILRYIYLVYRRREGGEPESLILRDKPLLFNTLVWLVVMVIAHRSP